MKTDHFLYQIFRRDPHLLFRLVGLERDDDYTFESITVKQTERRADGLFVPAHGRGPNLFAEFQGYDDPAVYWRAIRRVATWHESNPRKQHPFVVVVLFLDPCYDPGEPPLEFRPPNRLLRANLAECLSRLRGQPGLQVVLEPLVLEERSDLAARSRAWKGAIERLNFSKKDRTFWLEQLEYAIVRRFPDLKLEEIKSMLQIMPLEETTAGRQIKSLGRKEGLRHGALIGRIGAYQRLLRLEETPQKTLEAMTEDQLRALLADLERAIP